MRKLVPSLPFYQKDLIKSKMRIEKNKGAVAKVDK